MDQLRVTVRLMINLYLNLNATNYTTCGIICSIIICSIKKKTVYYKQWKKTCSKDNKLGSEDLYKIYKDYRFELRKIIRAAKKEFYHRKLENVKGDMKKTWKLSNELRGNNEDKVSTSFVIDGKLVLDHREISNEFNLFFSSIARKMNSKVYSSTLINSTNEITTHVSWS